MASVLKPGTAVWCPHQHACWVRAVIRTNTDGVLCLTLDETGEEIDEVAASSICEVDPTHDADLPDVVAMSNLHEAPLLHLLRRRLLASNIYTWVGQGILLSVNPYCTVPAYGRAQLEFARDAVDFGEPPHIYAIARRAHMGVLLAGSNNQSCVLHRSIPAWMASPRLIPCASAHMERPMVQPVLPVMQDRHLWRVGRWEDGGDQARH